MATPSKWAALEPSSGISQGQEDRRSAGAPASADSATTYTCSVLESRLVAVLLLASGMRTWSGGSPISSDLMRRKSMGSVIL